MMTDEALTVQSVHDELVAEIGRLHHELEGRAIKAARLYLENKRMRAALVAVKIAYDSASWTDAVALAMPAVRAALADERVSHDEA